MLDIKRKPKQNKGLIAKTTRKKVVNGATSKHICNEAIIRVLEEY